MNGLGAFEVVDPGILTTVQDTGRWGYQSYGVSVSGVMDSVAHRRANGLVGNRESAASLEVTLRGPTLRFLSEVRLAVSGAVFLLFLDEMPVSLDTVIHAKPGQELRFGARSSGARAYVAVAGGIDVTPVLGSRSTHLPSRCGGVLGRAVKRGDTLAIGNSADSVRRPNPMNRWLRPTYAGGCEVRVLPSVHQHWFDAEAIKNFQNLPYSICVDSDRMGYRLEGVAITWNRTEELLSQPLVMGAVQIPPKGKPIIAMADRQTVGGYPRIANVISADLPLLGQLAPGDWVSFQMCTREEAYEAYVEVEAEFVS